MALWNCQSAVNKVDFISAFSLQSTLSILGLTETWICPEDSATPAALSNNLSFSHTPRQVGRGGGTGLLRSYGGSAPRDDLYGSECQRRPGHLDEPQRQIPSEDLVT